jgi:hypothetical protein
MTAYIPYAMLIGVLRAARDLVEAGESIDDAIRRIEELAEPLRRRLAEWRKRALLPHMRTRALKVIPELESKLSALDEVA